MAHKGSKLSHCSQTQRLPLRKPHTTFSLDVVSPSLEEAKVLPRLGLAHRECVSDRWRGR